MTDDVIKQAKLWIETSYSNTNKRHHTKLYTKTIQYKNEINEQTRNNSLQHNPRVNKGMAAFSTFITYSTRRKYSILSNRNLTYTLKLLLRPLSKAKERKNNIFHV